MRYRRIIGIDPVDSPEPLTLEERVEMMNILDNLDPNVFIGYTIHPPNEGYDFMGDKRRLYDSCKKSR